MDRCEQDLVIAQTLAEVAELMRVSEANGPCRWAQNNLAMAVANRAAEIAHRHAAPAAPLPEKDDA